MEAPKRITVYFYKTKSGREPVRDWLKDLKKEEKILIGGDIKTVEFGWPIGMPVCRPLGDGLYEVRSTLENTISRVFFTIAGSQMILLHGIIKKSQKTPKNELDIAKARLKEVKS